MKPNYKKIAIALGAAVISLTSCSREITSLKQVNKLNNEQALEKQNIPAKKAEPLALIQPQPAQLLPPTTNPTITPSNPQKTIKLAQARKLAHHSIAGMMPKKVGKEIIKQANTLRHLGSDNQVASISSTNHTQSWLGLAIVCLIVGIILAILGFAELGALFWAIGIIILVVAIVFFILWLMAEAVAG